MKQNAGSFYNCYYNKLKSIPHTDIIEFWENSLKQTIADANDPYDEGKFIYELKQPFVDFLNDLTQGKQINQLPEIENEICFYFALFGDYNMDSGISYNIATNRFE